MVSTFFIVFCVQGLIIQTTLGQCINRAPNGPSLNQILQSIGPHNIVQQNPNIIQQHPQIFQHLPQLIQQQPHIIQQQPHLIQQQQPHIIQQQPHIIQQQQPQIIQQQPIGENIASLFNSAGQYGGPPAILHDNTVSNNLAHALQLLVVSNLLSNTLPGSACLEDLPPKGYVQSVSQYAPPPPPPPCPCNGGPFVNGY